MKTQRSYLNYLSNIPTPIYRRLAFLWLLLTIVLSLMSSKTVSKLSFADFVGIDKLGHLGFYAILTFLWYMALRKKKMHKNVVFVLFILLGALMEFLQTQLALGRIFEWNDLLANIIGAIIGRNLYLRNFKVTI